MRLTIKRLYEPAIGFKIIVCCLSSFFTPVLSAQNNCPANIDFEAGTFDQWKCYTGTNLKKDGVVELRLTETGAASERHTIIPATSTEKDPYGNFPIKAPGGGQYSIRLGNERVGSQAERISYLFTIPTDEYTITYQYAVVFQDPQHGAEAQPSFAAKIFDVETNQYIGCNSFNYVATSNLPGFKVSGVLPLTGTVLYKDWTAVTVNLSGYAGKQVILEFTTVDCTEGGHFGYAYIDVNSECSAPVQGNLFCPDGGALSLTGPSGYKDYQWYDESFSRPLGTGQKLQLATTPVADTKVALIVIPYDGFGCRDTVFSLVKLYPEISVGAGDDHYICPGQSAQIGMPAIQNHSYVWTSAVPIQNPQEAQSIVSPASDASYFLTVTNTETGCFKKDTVHVYVAVPPSLFEMPRTDGCTSDTLRFQNPNPTTLSYLWDFGDGEQTNVFNPNHIYKRPGSYTVRLTATSGAGCESTTTKSIEIFESPIATITTSHTELCEGEFAVLTAGGGDKYQWIQDNTMIADQARESITVNSGGNFRVVVESNNGCKALSKTISVILHQKPRPDFDIQGLCVNHQTKFQNKTIDNSGFNFQWQFGNGEQSNLKDPITVYKDSGSYSVSLMTTFSQCPNFDTVIKKSIRIERPVAGIQYPLLETFAGFNLQLKARSFGTNYRWTPANGLNNSILANPQFNGEDDQLYQIEITTPAGCITVDTQQIKVRKDLVIFVPNAFTPNGDGKNDRLKPVLGGIKEVKYFRIYNRWGNVVYSSKSGAQGWDGSYKGQQQSANEFVWELEVIDRNGKSIQRKGVVLLMR